MQAISQIEMLKIVAQDLTFIVPLATIGNSFIKLVIIQKACSINRARVRRPSRDPNIFSLARLAVSSPPRSATNGMIFIYLH
jgi:hypothetical protein